jgi:Zn-dependent peptidase ImmA (M78 family)
MIRSREARKRAEQVLGAVGIIQPPVDVYRIAKFLGFEVYPFEFPDSTDGLTFIEDNIKTIGINSNHAPVRQRFSIGHELGHYLMGHENYDHGATYIEDRPSFMDPQHRQEVEANEFSAQLLMPPTMLKRDVSEVGLDSALLSKRYEVSEQAMWIQLIDLGLASQHSGRK